MFQVYPERMLTNLKNVKYIPRDLEAGEHLRLYHKYWIPYFNQVYKLRYIEEIDGVEYYYLENRDGTQLYTYPIGEAIKEFTYDRKDLNTCDVINDNRKYYGYEIKYWFHFRIHKIYKNFGIYVDMNSQYCIADNKIYKVKAVLENDVYKDCKIIAIK